MSERKTLLATLKSPSSKVDNLQKTPQKQNPKKQNSPAGTRQIEGKKPGLVWRNRKKISQIVNDYLYIPLFLLIIL